MTKITLRRLTVAAVLVALAAPVRAAPAAADDPNVAKAREVYDKARLHYKIGDFDKAIEAFREAYRLTPTPLILFNIAQAYRLIGNYKQSKFFFGNYLLDMPKAPNRPEVERQIEQLDALIAEEAKRQGGDARAAANDAVAANGKGGARDANPIAGRETGGGATTAAKADGAVPTDPVRGGDASVAADPVKGGGTTVAVDPVEGTGKTVAVDPVKGGGTTVAVDPVKGSGTTVAVDPAKGPVAAKPVDQAGFMKLPDDLPPPPPIDPDPAGKPVNPPPAEASSGIGMLPLGLGAGAVVLGIVGGVLYGFASSGWNSLIASERPRVEQDAILQSANANYRLSVACSVGAAALAVGAGVTFAF